MTALLVALGAVLGAPSRYLLDTAVRGRWGAPWGTLAVNLLGCLAAGTVVGAAPADSVRSLLVVGFLGAFTTASTLAAELLERRTARGAAGLLALHVGAGLVLAGAGLALGRTLLG